MKATLKPLWVRIGLGVLISALIVFALFLVVVFMFARISYSHVAANVPSDQEFERLLERDLRAYLETRLGEPLEVSTEFLRKGPTQAGVSYPHFYLWVVASRSGSDLQEAAVTVDAVERKGFHVRDFVTKEQAKQNPEILQRTFPGPVCREIEKRLNRVQRPAA